MTLPSLETTAIPGLVVVRLDRRDDDRGFFKENWQREKMLAHRAARLRSRAEQRVVQQ